MLFEYSGNPSFAESESHLHVLLSNDDGVEAPGIAKLAARLEERARVTVIAPDRDRSGASNSLTLDEPIRISRGRNGFIGVRGTPTDCVHIALTGFMESDPDMVISGINSGPNLGDDVLYSGTVAAAMEGRFLGLPAIAVSMFSEERVSHWDSGCEAVMWLIDRILSKQLPADTILNVNVPDLPWEEMRGFQATRLGHRHRAERVIEAKDPRGRPIFWIGPPGSEQDAGPGTDFHAVKNGFVSVTPLSVDLTRYAALDTLASWVTEDVPG